MGCFPCCASEEEKEPKKHEPVPVAQPQHFNPPPAPAAQSNNTPVAHANITPTDEEEASNTGTAKTFTFRELASATKHFRQECLLGEGGIGKIFKATFPSTGQTMAVRQLDRNRTQGSKEFQVEVLILSLLHHPNLVDLIGYCADGEQRLLVYEYIPTGTLESHLFDIPEDKRALDWSTRLKIASGIAEGLEYLHEKANPPIIYRNLKSSNIMMDEGGRPKLSQYGLAKLLQSGSKMNMSAYGYCAPEHERHGEITPKSDVYSFGVVLLELITGRRAYDCSRPREEQSLVGWAQPIFRDPKRFPDMADPLLQREFSVKTLNQAIGVVSMCLQEEPSVRPFITDVVATLSFLATAPPDEPIPDHLVPILSSKVEPEHREYEEEVESTNDDSSERSEDGSEIGEISDKFERPKSSSSDGSESGFSPGFDGR